MTARRSARCATWWKLYRRFSLTSDQAQAFPYFTQATVNVGPDGKLAGTTYTGSSVNVEVYDPATGSATLLAQSAIEPSWSPDGTGVLFAEGPEFSRPTKWSVAKPNGQPAASLTAGDGLSALARKFDHVSVAG